MILVSQARLYWVDVECGLQNQREAPIVTWDEMKLHLRVKYLPQSYQDRLLDQRSNLRQGSMSVTEYINKFEELNLRCNVQEDLSGRISKFRTGLRQEFQRKLITVKTASLEDIYEVVLNLEAAMKSKQAKRSDYRGTDSKPYPLSGKPNFGGQPPRNHATIPPAFKDNKGKGIVGDNSKWSNSVTCHNCNGRGHLARDCPSRNLCIEDVEDESDPTVDAYIPDFVPSDDDCGDLEDRVSFL